MSLVVHVPGEADDVWNKPTQVLYPDIKSQPAGYTAVESINILSWSWQHNSTSLNSFRGLWASRKILQCKTVRIKVTILRFLCQASYTTGIQGNLSPCTDFQWEIWIFRRRVSGQKAVHPKQDHLSTLIFCFSNYLHCQNQSTLWLCCLKGYIEAKLQMHTKLPTPHNS